jgi:hypothetical protein
VVDASWLPVAGPPYHNVSKMNIVERIVWGDSTRDSASDTNEHRHPDIRERLEYRPSQSPSVYVARLARRTGRDDDGMATDRAANISILVVVHVVGRATMLIVEHQPCRQQLEVRDGADPRDVVVGAVERGLCDVEGHFTARAITT